MLQSSLTGEFFDEKDCVRIVNPKQAAVYWSEYGIKPFSIYPSKDLNDNSPIIVFLFSKSRTKDAYEKWTKQKR
jgi:hypothetical protein